MTNGTNAHDGLVEEPIADGRQWRRDGVVVRKAVGSDGGQSTVAFEVRSEREDATRVRVCDPLPAAYDVEEHGIYPRDGNELAVEGGKWVVLECDLAPGERHVARYGIEATDIDRLEALLGDPVLEVEPVESGAAIGDGGRVEDRPDQEGDVGTAAADHAQGADVERRLERLEERIEELAAAVDEGFAAVDDDLADLASELDGIRETVEEGAAWRDAVSQSFAADPGEDGAEPADPEATDGSGDAETTDPARGAALADGRRRPP